MQMGELRNNEAKTNSYEVAVCRFPHAEAALAWIMTLQNRCPPVPSALLRLVELSAFVFSSTWSPFAGVFTLCLCTSVAQWLQMCILHSDKMIGVTAVLGVAASRCVVTVFPFVAQPGECQFNLFLFLYIFIF